MPLRARSAEKEYSAYSMNKDEWGVLKETYQTVGLTMPCCSSPAIPKTSSLGTQFFAHLKKMDCASENESAEHLYLKSIVAHAASDTDWDVITEYRGESPEKEIWIADVLCVKNNTKVAFEIQLSKQSKEDTQQRQFRYKSSGVRCAWLISDKSFKGSGIVTNKELPFFTMDNIEVGSEPKIAEFDVSLTSFIQGVLSGKLTWNIEPARYEIECLKSLCWKCNKEILQPFGFSHDWFDKRIMSIPNASDFFEHLLGIVGNEKLIQNSINSIGRFDRVSGKKTHYPFCNVCINCGAPQNNFYLYQAITSDDKSTQCISIESFENGYGSWGFSE